MTVNQAIAVMGGIPKSALRDHINLLLMAIESQEPSPHFDAMREAMTRIRTRFCSDDCFPPDAVLVSAEYAEVGLHQIKGAYGEVDVAGKPQSHLATVDVFIRKTGGCGWRSMPGAKVVVVD